MKKRDPNYRGMFLVGIILIAIGISLISLQPKPVGIVFISVGGLFLMISLKNKDKWIIK
jgi:ABC-type enterobactin transport system permease subunit